MIRQDILHTSHGKVMRIWSTLGVYIKNSKGEKFEDICIAYDHFSNEQYVETDELISQLSPGELA